MSTPDQTPARNYAHESHAPRGVWFDLQLHLQRSPLRRGFILVPASLLIAFTPIVRGSTTTGFQVTAAVAKACVISTPPTLGFGTYDPNSSTPVLGTTSFNVTCTAGTSFSIGLSSGNGAGATVTNRVLTSSSASAGSNTLTYALHKDEARTQSWDNSATATGYTGTGSVQPITVYGQIPGAQYKAAPAADYTDTILMTLTY